MASVSRSAVFFLGASFPRTRSCLNLCGSDTSPARADTVTATDVSASRHPFGGVLPTCFLYWPLQLGALGRCTS